MEQNDSKYSYTPSVALSCQITKNQLESIIKFHGDNNYYNFLYHNCVYVAMNAWNLVSDTQLWADYGSAYTPISLKECIELQDGYIAYYDIINIIDYVSVYMEY